MRIARHILLTGTLAFAAFALVAQGADAQNRSYSRLAKSGKTQWIDAYFGWNDDCSFKTINVDVVDQPSHGQVSPKIENSKITAAQIGSTRDCLGKPTRAVAVYYKSKGGYRGTDSFKVRMSVGGSAPVFFNYTVSVR